MIPIDSKIIILVRNTTVTVAGVLKGLEISLQVEFLQFPLLVYKIFAQISIA